MFTDMENKYSIKAVSTATGINEHTIRAWEKRYKAISPERSDSNRRMYSEAEVEKLHLLGEAVMLGHNIGSIAQLSVSDLKSLLNKKINPSSEYSFKNDLLETDEIIIKCTDAIKAYDGGSLETLLLKASTKMSQPHLIENLVVPLIYQVGDLWHDGIIRIANEHLASSVIRFFLMNLIDLNSPTSSAPVIISATPRGQEHELGALIVGVIASSIGWKVIYLGANLPVEEIAAAADNLKAKIVSLSIVYPVDDPQLYRDLKNLKKMLPSKVSIIAGGRAVDGYKNILDEIGAVIVKDTKELNAKLESFRFI
jgi:methanogenic corrinoid protein MtbC1